MNDETRDDAVAETVAGTVIVGRVRKPHGIHGELVVETMCDEPDAIFAPGRRLFVGDASGTLLAGAAAECEVARARPFKGGLIVALVGVPDRNASELWRDRRFLVPESELGPLDDGEIWVRELPGMRVELTTGAVVGTVREVTHVPQGLLLEVDSERGAVTIPFVAPIVVAMDRDGRVITIDPPAGLLEL